MRRETRARHGTILLEVVVGLTILTIAGVAWIVLLAQTRAAIASVRIQEARTRAAGDLLQRYRFLSESEYDARLGTTRVGSLTINVSSIAPHLYALAALDSNARAIILTTTVYARDTTSSSH